MKSVSKIPPGYFMHLPQRVKTKMLRNIVEVGFNPTRVLVGDYSEHSSQIEWCEQNCSGLFYVEGHIFFFESPVDKTLFLTAQPCGSDYR